MSGRNRAALSVTFDVVLALLVFWQLGALAQRANQRAALERLGEKKSTLSETLIGANGDAEKINSATAAFHEERDATFEHLEYDALFHELARHEETVNELVVKLGQLL